MVNEIKISQKKKYSGVAGAWFVHNGGSNRHIKAEQCEGWCVAH